MTGTRADTRGIVGAISRADHGTAHDWRLDADGPIGIFDSGVGGLTATATNNVEFVIADTAGTGAGAAYSLRINGQDIFASYDQENLGVLTAAQISDAINAQSSNTGVTASLAGTDLRLSAADGLERIEADAASC